MSVDIDRMQKLCDRASASQMVCTKFLKPDGSPIQTIEDIAETMEASACHSQVPALFGVALNDEDENNAATVVCYTGNGPTSEANAAFFAESRNAMPDLLAELRKLRALRDRVDAMFPVAPWDDGPITAEVCERLGIKVSGGQEMNWEYRGGHGFHVEICTTNEGDEFDGATVVVGNSEFRRMTAGQLACLVAARRKKQCSNS